METTEEIAAEHGTKRGTNMTWGEAFRRAFVAVVALIAWYAVGLVISGLGAAAIGVAITREETTYSGLAVAVVGAVIAVGGVVAIAMDRGEEKIRIRYGLPVVVVGLLITVLGVTPIRGEFIVGGLLIVVGAGIILLAAQAIIIKTLTDAVSDSLVTRIGDMGFRPTLDEETTQSPVHGETEELRDAD